jgi:hypothetical protein
MEESSWSRKTAMAMGEAKIDTIIRPIVKRRRPPKRHAVPNPLRMQVHFSAPSTGAEPCRRKGSGRKP